MFTWEGTINSYFHVASNVICFLLVQEAFQKKLRLSPFGLVKCTIVLCVCHSHWTWTAGAFKINSTSVRGNIKIPLTEKYSSNLNWPRQGREFPRSLSSL